MEKFLISVITITYNCQNEIEKTIKSVLNQNYSDIEYIIVDGKSSDSTMHIVEKYQDKISTIISEEDTGISDAFNKGIRHATGNVIFFLNAGDTFCDNMVLEAVSKDWKKSKVDIVFYRVRVGNNTFIPAIRENNPKKIWYDAQIPHQGAFIAREVFQKVGGFNSAIRIRMDYDFFARCRVLGMSYRFISKVVVEYKPGGASMQTSNAKCFYKEGLGIKILYNMDVKVSDILYIIVPMWMRKLAKKIIKR